MASHTFVITLKMSNHHCKHECNLMFIMHFDWWSPICTAPQHVFVTLYPLMMSKLRHPLKGRDSQTSKQ